MTKILIIFALLTFIYAKSSNNDDLDKTMFHDYVTHNRKFYFNE